MKVLWIVLGICLFVLLAVCGLAFWIQSSLTTPIEHAKAEQFITIEKGSAPSQIVAKLAVEGVLRSSIPALIYLKTLGNPEGLKAGVYKFPSPISPLQVLAELEKGEQRPPRLVIPEGFTIFDIAKRVDQFQRDREDLDQALAIEPSGKEILSADHILTILQDPTPIRDIAPEAKSLEGYLYPSTYDLAPGTRPEAAIRKMVEQFRKIWKPEWTVRAKAIGRTPHEIVTIASLIETETAVPAERPIVASVIYNRLSKGIPLGIDMTNIYIAKMEGRWDGTINRSDLQVDSPYNTRKHSGIPPGPISSVSESSILAALNPVKTNNLYYVRNVEANDGSHWFYSSAAEFERGKAEYQRWLEKERQEKRMNEANNSNSIINNQ